MHEKAVETVLDSSNPLRVRDQGHGGMTLKDFENSEIARQASLTQAEVATLRLYTGPLFEPWNKALRDYKKDQSLFQSWQTCISVLYNAVVSLSYLSKPAKVYRGVNESIRQLPRSFYDISSNDFAGIIITIVMIIIVIIFNHRRS